MEVTEKSTISSDNYDEILKMLSSNDNGSITMAMAILEQSDFEKSQLYILCLLKNVYNSIFGGASNKLREADYPLLFSNVASKLKEQDETDVSSISFKKIFEIAKKRNEREELSFILKTLKLDLEKLLEEFGFEFTKDLDMEFKVKGQPCPKELEIAELKTKLRKYETQYA